eukprot:CAMPEP_0116842362 /NCGR_PEP_ID=MMETSP0418-20121206/11470_1 /TAXON_ID=1158023 /ORGANISM="Astrosyne radiata, Strain 13vi08-1A" /LENGTH=75 /DNA_ID=CAMNT_0004472955 /DNA_START=135 /DNA_END=362 /DNA_ORIENTATION=+
MSGMDATQWGISILFMFVTFIIMEAEKALRRHLKASGQDTDDLEQDPLFDSEPAPITDAKLPDSAARLATVELNK